MVFDLAIARYLGVIHALNVLVAYRILVKAFLLAITLRLVPIAISELLVALRLAMM